MTLYYMSFDNKTPGLWNPWQDAGLGDRFFYTHQRQRVSINGSVSQWLAVLSGISQGSVLGPVLFILYIHELPDLVKNFTMLFADDTKIYSVVNNERDKNSLQDDINKLIAWSEKG